MFGHNAAGIGHRGKSSGSFACSMIALESVSGFQIGGAD
jgi:hypothetical protein